MVEEKIRLQSRATEKYLDQIFEEMKDPRAGDPYSRIAWSGLIQTLAVA